MKFKTLTCLLIGALLVSVFALIPVGAAGNTTPDDFDFYSGRAGSNLWTGGRDKWDDSYVYMKCNSLTYYGVSGVNQYSAWVKGSPSLLGTYSDYSHGYVYTFYEGTTRYMLNWVYEELYGKGGDESVYAGVQGQYNGGSVPLDAEGVWSPDSVGGPN